MLRAGAVCRQPLTPQKKPTGKRVIRADCAGERVYWSRASSATLNLDGSNRGDAVIALDAIGVGVGDRVLLTIDGYSAMSSIGRMQSPIDAAVVGFIDEVELVDGVA